MLAALEGMITELRQIGVPISMTEKIDAVRSLNHLPLVQRDAVKSALRAALVKDHDHELAFDALFDLYFSPAPGADQEQTAQRGPADGQPATADGQPGTGHGQPGGGGGGGGGGGIGSLDDAALTELLLTALRDGNDVMLRAIAGMFVDRHAGIEPGRPVAGTYYVFRTLRAVDPDRLLARLVDSPDSPDSRATRDSPDSPDSPDSRGSSGSSGSQEQTGLLRRLQIERYQAQLQRFRQAVEAQVRRRLVDDRGAAAVARTLRRPLPEDVEQHA